MPRPCLCDRCRSGPYTLDQCRLCWLAANDPRCQQRWGLPVTALERGTRNAERGVQDGSSIPHSTFPIPHSDCVHLGPPTGAVAHCRSCQGHVQVKVLACAVYAECTLARKVAALACCRGCPSYEPAPAAPAAPGP